ncbi:MAG: FAD-binding protein [Acidobacteriota bacterium]
MPKSLVKELEGWGRYPRSVGNVYRPEKISTLSQILESRNQSAYIGRGLGRSYGDAALNSGRGVILTERLNCFLQLDAEHGLVTCEAGVTLQELLQVCLPRGWFPPVTPGTKFVTLGGAIACDVHGKNHHQDGSLSHHVKWIDLLLADGRQVRCSRQDDSDLFWATLGGLGLTGIILSAQLQLRRVETSYLCVDYRRTENLDETLRLLEEEDEGYTYSVAWVDCLASGSSMGRAVLMRGNHCRRDHLDSKLAREPLLARCQSSFSLPMELPSFCLNSLAVRGFNSLYYRHFKKGHHRKVEHYDRFFYPLDAVRHWNRAYGRRGFLQYQCALPPETARAALLEILGRTSAGGNGSFLAVLKRFGQETGLISFPMSGYTLALDFPMRGEPILHFLDGLDDLVLRNRGRVYLGKDARLAAPVFRQMYPRLPEWQRVKKRVDPENLFSSDLSRRLRMGGAPP